MAKNNYLQSNIEDMEPSNVHEIVTSLKDLHDRGKPQTDEEIKQRIDDFFAYCQDSCIRPGIETLCAALCISRTTLFNWNNGKYCSPQCQEYVQSAKALISAYIEQAVLSGKISPPSGIFLMKNWLGYRDVFSLEQAALENDNTADRHLASREELGLEVPTERPKLPGMGDYDK